MNIREAATHEIAAIRKVYDSAFPVEECETVGQLACALLTEEANPKVLSLVAEQDATIVGHVVFSPIFDSASDQWMGYILAPLAVSSEHQGVGIGTKLVEYGIRQLTKDGASIFLVYGDPKYYGRFGFQNEGAEQFIPPYKLQYPFGWQVLNLNDTAPVKIRCVQALCRPELW